MVSTAKRIAPTGLSSRARTIAFAILLPAAVAVTDQVLFEQLRTYPRLSYWLYPWMVASTAALSWTAGRYLRPSLLGWIVFTWTLALLDFLTIAACMDGSVTDNLGYVLVSSEITLLIAWAVLAAAPWQWRLPAVLVAVAAVIVFSGSFMGNWHVANWNALMVLVAAVVTTLCIALRFLGFRLHAETLLTHLDPAPPSSSSQFGTRDLLIWATAIVPLLLIAPKINLLSLRTLASGSGFSALLLAASVAAVDFLVMATILGSRIRAWLLVAVFCVPSCLGFAFKNYSEFFYAAYRNRAWVPYTPPFEMFFIDMRDDWTNWFCFNAAILAALLLFLRGKGYRLERSPLRHLSAEATNLA